MNPPFYSWIMLGSVTDMQTNSSFNLGMPHAFCRIIENVLKKFFFFQLCFCVSHWINSKGFLYISIYLITDLFVLQPVLKVITS